MITDQSTVAAPQDEAQDSKIPDAISFLKAVLPETGYKFLAIKHVDGLQHVAFENIAEMGAAAVRYAHEGKDVYFACAGYAQEAYVDTRGKMRFRTQENAVAAESFWLDIDVGEEKPYKSQAEGLRALMKFCKANGLPRPTIVSSGYGVHCYWVMEEDVPKDAWLILSAALKTLTKSAPNPLSVDQSRTSDIASVLRPVGTLNYKLPPRTSPVKLLATSFPLSFQEWDGRIKGVLAQLTAKTAERINSTPDNSCQPPSLEELEEILRYINPDASDRAYWWGIVAALADAYGEAGRELARRWSQGSINGYGSTRYLEADFDDQYTDCLGRSYQGERVTIGTIIHRAREGGWTGRLSAVPDWVDEINMDYAWIEQQAWIYRIELASFIRPESFRIQFGNRYVEIKTEKGMKSVPMGNEWLRHPARRQHKKLVMRPAEPQVTHDNCLNIWSGFAKAPAKGDVAPFVALLKRLVPDRAAAMYVLQWMAHLIQHPSVKIHTALVVWSHTQGVGKNLLFECLTAIVGPRHATLIGQADLARDFNEWAKDRILVIGDEVSGNDRREHEDKLKGLITGTTIQINPKNQPVYEADNLVNFVFLSNRANAMFLDDNDRRYFVWEVQADRLAPDVAKAFCAWRDGGGLEALLYKLSHVSLDGFDPKAPAPFTAAKKEMIEDNRSDFEAWAVGIMGAANAPGGVEVSTSAALAAKYHAENPGKTVSQKTVTTTFKKLGAYKHPSQVRLPDGSKVRPIALANVQHWKRQSSEAWGAELARL